MGSEAGRVSDQGHRCEDKDGLEGDTHTQAETHREKDDDEVRRKQAKWTHNEA